MAKHNPGNAGVCHRLGQMYGLGSESRGIDNHFPDPYAIESGNSADLPAGYEEKWLINVHAIDTRNVVHKLGCIECTCSLYNVTIDKFGEPIKPDYEGGLYCCYDKTQCKVKTGFEHSFLEAIPTLYCEMVRLGRIVYSC